MVAFLAVVLCRVTFPCGSDNTECISSYSVAGKCSRGGKRGESERRLCGSGGGGGCGGLGGKEEHGVSVVRWWSFVCD